MPPNPPGPGLPSIIPQSQHGPLGTVDTPLPLSYNTGPWRRARWGAATELGALAATNAFLWQNALPTLAGLATNQALIAPVDRSMETAMKFYGVAASGDTATCRVWGLKEWREGPVIEYTGDPLLDLTLTFGTGTFSGSRCAADYGTLYRAVNNIAIAADYTISPNAKLVGYDSVGAAWPAGGWAIVNFDKTPGYFGYVVQILKAGTVTGWEVLHNG